MEVIVEFVDEHRTSSGSSRSARRCRSLRAATTPRRSASSSHRPGRCATRSMMPILLALWVANRKVYGAQKLWKAARRAGHDIGRDQVVRLMRALEIEGVTRQRKKVFTTRADPDALRAPDLVDRNFSAAAPNRLWVTDLTYVPTRSGMAYVCFIVDAFSRRIVGWRVASNMRTEMVLDALEMARRSRGARRLVGLIAHSDAGSQFTSVRFTERLDEIGARPSIGTVADSYDNALGGNDERALQDRVRLRARRRRLGRRRRTRTRDTVVGPLVQRGATPRALRPRAPSRVRSRPSTLRPRHPAECSETKPPSLHQTQGDSFIQMLRSSGFEAIWLVGPTAALTYRLDQ